MHLQPLEVSRLHAEKAAVIMERDVPASRITTELTPEIAPRVNDHPDIMLSRSLTPHLATLGCTRHRVRQNLTIEKKPSQDIPQRQNANHGLRSPHLIHIIITGFSTMSMRSSRDYLDTVRQVLGHQARQMLESSKMSPMSPSLVRKAVSSKSGWMRKQQAPAPS